MAIIHLPRDRLLTHSPTPLKENLAKEIAGIGGGRLWS
jgi:hypothetical protein